jgi:hypothetical protein
MTVKQDDPNIIEVSVADSSDTTTTKLPSPTSSSASLSTQVYESPTFTSGLVLGLLIGEGSFGGDGKQAQVTLRMHVRHEPLLRWIAATIPGGKLYGPYNHGGRHYYQWMARGEVLKNILVPLLDSLPFAKLDPHSHARYQKMKEQYKL